MIKVTIFTALATTAFIYGAGYVIQSQYELAIACTVILFISLWHLKLAYNDYLLLVKTRTNYRKLLKENQKLKTTLQNTQARLFKNATGKK